MEIVLKHIYKIFIYIYVDEDFLLMCVKMKNMLEDELGCGIFFPEVIGLGSETIKSVIIENNTLLFLFMLLICYRLSF